ncbi:MAG: cytochrome c biogenesis protein CcsA [Deltaproteobacteria bacterium]|jgi:ABC-type transport system involved in cytochrome c biogenesis permease subunit|nr:cytochrome c biogenesis protein CcsA [Deltaproteobacteria bacterium]
MSWSWHDYLAPLSVALWVLGALMAIKTKPRPAFWLTVAGTLVTGLFIAGLWLRLERPPMRTMGETRLWYSFFLSGAGALVYARRRFTWLLIFGCLLASVFAIINVVKPELHSKALMPALQSPFFIPHVISYMLSYAVLAASALASAIQLRKISASGEPDKNLDDFIDSLVRSGLGLLMLGLLTGAIWAKQAWGHYWSWDPKETWAMVTAATFLIYIHLRRAPPRGAGRKLALAVPLLGLVMLMITWLGVSYLPAAMGSVHIY